MIKPGAFKEFIRNLGALTLALVLAIAVWVSAVTSADPDEIRTYPRPVPLEIIGQDPGLVIIGKAPESINLRLRAPRSVWDKLSSADTPIRAVVDLAGLSVGGHDLDVQIQIRVAPVQVLSVSPQNIHINLEALASKTFPISLTVRGEVAIGFKADTPKMDTSEITLSGPAPLIAKVSHIQADFSIVGLREDTDISLPLRILDGSGNVVEGLTPSPANVQVHIPITQQGGYRDIAVKVVVRGQVAGGYRLTNISVFPLILTVYSKQPALVDVLPGFVETETLNLDGASDDIDTHLSLHLPEGISIVGDQTVQVRVGIAAIEDSRNLNNQKVEVIGLADGMTATISPETVDMILTGPLPLLNKLSAGDVKIIVDLTGLEVGEHKLTPQPLTIINDVKVQSINPTTIEVNISLAGKPTGTPTAKPAAALLQISF